MVARKVNTMKRDIQEDLDQRRGRLARMLAEEQFAEQYGAEIRQALESWGFSLSSYGEAPKA